MIEPSKTTLTSWKYYAFITAAILVTTSISYAQGSENWLSVCYRNSTCHTVASVGVGAAIASDIGRSQTFPIVNPVTDEFFIYSINHSTQMTGALDGFVGIEWTPEPTWALQMGLGYDETWDFRGKGSLLQGADIPSANQYSYHYDILTRQLLIESKLLYRYQQRYYPYILLGLGAAFNEAKGYDTNVPPFLTFTRQYKNNTQTSFSYAIGIGADVDVLQHLRFGLGYRFVNLGQVTLGNASIDTTSVSGTLSQTHLFASEILAQFTYVG